MTEQANTVGEQGTASAAPEVEAADLARDGLRPGSTMRDVARVAGVSTQTVSNVLNAPARVRPQTRERVETAIATLGFRVNRQARNLRTGSSRLIGYAFPNTPDHSPVLDAFLHSVTEAAEAAGYHVMLFAPPPITRDPEPYHRLTGEQAVDGFILSGTVYDDPRVDALLELDLPFVTFGRTWGSHDHAWVDIDGATGTRLVTTHLIERGRRRFAFLGWPDNSAAGDERERGVRDTLADVLPGVALVVVRSVNDIDAARTATTALLGRPGPAPDAIVAASDALAIGAVLAAQDAGVRIGVDLAIAGFDDAPIGRVIAGGLTTVRQPLALVGVETVRLLHAQFEGRSVEGSGVLLTPELVVRATT